MKMRKFLHVLAITLSSLLSVVTHSKGQDVNSTNATKEKKGEGELAKHHRRHTGATSRATNLASQDPPARPRRHHGNDIKNSDHAAVWSSYASQADADAPAMKLNPAIMASAEPSFPSTPISNTSFVAPPPLPGDENSRYPWRREIVTTTFWVGEAPSHNNPVPNSASCWDPNWARNYGGSDPEEKAQRTSDFIPASFTPNENPFYVALPYNDMVHGTLKPEASQVVPWFAKAYTGPTKSVCHGRWIAIRFGNKVCYAQWEDAGPFRTDHWQYVFGTDRPRWNLNRGAGLDVSPAVRDYLGMNSTDVTDWKFVDFEEVPTGPWAKYGEHNTFVENERKSESKVAEIFQDAASGIRSLFPGISGPGSDAH
ncbi:MAG TPA: hypothetical protein VHY22_16385 [Chthoniobacteraceae bacterium]|jgi:hypothetical protein|nr:hypothetical protein [Chthoniobacteraceae bacterium]